MHRIHFLTFNGKTELQFDFIIIRFISILSKLLRPSEILNSGSYPI